MIRKISEIIIENVLKSFADLRYDTIKCKSFSYNELGTKSIEFLCTKVRGVNNMYRKTKVM